MEKKNYTKLCISPSLENPKGMYRHQGNGGQGDKPWPEAARVPRPFWGRAWRFEPRAVPSVPCQALVSVSGFAPLVLTNQLF